jgi:hypothetical protein
VHVEVTAGCRVLGRLVPAVLAFCWANPRLLLTGMSPTVRGCSALKGHRASPQTGDWSGCSMGRAVCHAEQTRKPKPGILMGNSSLLCRMTDCFVPYNNALDPTTWVIRWSKVSPMYALAPVPNCWPSHAIVHMMLSRISGLARRRSV